MRSGQTLSQRLCALGLSCLSMVNLFGCGGGPSGSTGGGGNGGGGTTTTVTSLAVAPVNPICTAGATINFTAAATGTNNPAWTANWSAPSGTFSTASNTAATTYTCPMVTVQTSVLITATSTVTTSVTGTTTATVNPAAPPPPTLSLSCNTTETTNIGTVSCTPTETGAANPITLTVSPTNTGTLSVVSGVSPGTPIVFTPVFISPTGDYPFTASIGASAGSIQATPVTITIARRTITLNPTSGNLGNVWLQHCSGLFSFNETQTGMVAGDTYQASPYAPSTVPANLNGTFPILFGIGNVATQPNPCSPGAYNQYVTGTDGAESNHHYLPIFGPGNMSAGHNATDTYLVDYAAGATYKFKLSDGSQDGAPLPLATVFMRVDGSNLVYGGYGNGIGVVDAATGTQFIGAVPSHTGDIVVNIAAKNGIVGYTNTGTTGPGVSYFPEVKGSGTIADVNTVGTSPGPIAMSAGACNPNLAFTTGFTTDVEGLVLDRSDVTTTSTGFGTVAPSATRVGSVSLTGVTPASQLPVYAVPPAVAAPRLIATWDSTCKVALLMPVLTNNNPVTWDMDLALFDMSTGVMKQLGSNVNSTMSPAGVVTTIPATAVNMVPDNTGSSVVITSTNETAGTCVLTEVSWTLDANENPTFTVTALNSAPAVGNYCPSIDYLPNGQLGIGQRPSLGEYGVFPVN